MDIIEEYKKVTEDIVYFIEKYCTINGKPIILKDYEKKILRNGK